MAHQAKHVTLKVQCTLPEPMGSDLLQFARDWGYSPHDLAHEALRQFYLGKVEAGVIAPCLPIQPARPEDGLGAGGHGRN